MTSGWVLGKDGIYRVDPKWKNPEVTLPPKKYVTEMTDVVKEEVDTLNHQAEMVDIGKSAVKREVEERTRVVDHELTRQDQKKKYRGTLGPRGCRRHGGKNHYGGQVLSPNYSESNLKVEGLARVQKKLKQEGYGVFKADFQPPTFESKKTYSFLTQDMMTELTWDCYKLAESYREKPTVSCFNPFAQGMPFGESQPLPR